MIKRGQGLSREALGRNGYPAIVPGTDYAAVSVHTMITDRRGFPAGTWISTDICHVGDDPLWCFLPEEGEDGPDNRDINAVHRSAYRKVSALSHEYGPHIWRPMEKAGIAKFRKWLRHLMKRWPLAKSITIETSTGMMVMGCVRSSGQYSIRARWSDLRGRSIYGSL